MHFKIKKAYASKRQNITPLYWKLKIYDFLKIKNNILVFTRCVFTIPKNFIAKFET
jgi:hypothetical protein